MKGIKNTKNNSDETNAKLKKFIEYIRLTQKNQKTVKNYTSDLKQFSFWLKQQGYGEEIGLYEVDQYLAHLSSKKSISSIKRAKSTLYQFLAWQSSLNKINLNYSEDKPVVVKEENRISPVILFVVLLIIISQAYLPFKGSTTNTLSTTQDVQTPYIKETRVVNPELSFKPSNAKSIVVLSEPLETDVDQDVMPLVVDEVDYSMLYSDPDMGSQQISTSGKGIIPPYHNKVEIISPFAQKDSNIQITPTTSTKNKVLYVSKQTDKSFTVAIDETISEQINFVWTIN